MWLSSRIWTRSRATTTQQRLQLSSHLCHPDITSRAHAACQPRGRNHIAVACACVGNRDKRTRPIIELRGWMTSLGASLVHERGKPVAARATAASDLARIHALRHALPCSRSPSVIRFQRIATSDNTYVYSRCQPSQPSLLLTIDPTDRWVVRSETILQS